MMRFIVFVLLLLIGRHVRGATENIVTSTPGSAVTLKAESAAYALNCTLETNRGEKLEYVPIKLSNHQIRGDIELIDNKQCFVSINKVNDSHAGVWKVTAYNEKNANPRNNDNTKVFLFKLYIYQKKAVSLSQYIEVYDGHYISVKHDENYKNLTACNLIGPKIKSINLLTEKRDGFQLFGQCGVHMQVNATYKGSWKLEAIVNDYVLYNMSFNVDVLEKRDPNGMLVIQWTRGSPGIISLSGLPKICQIINPNGVIVATSIGKCYYQVKVATVAHEGVWLARYNMYGMLESIDQKFRIETLDRVIFNTNVTRTENGSTTLLCRLETKDARPESCNFVRPNGTIIYMTPLIVTERYTGYVDSDVKRGRTEYKILECALTIRKPEDVDYGTWRCDLRIPNNTRSYGSVLHVDYPDSHGNTSAIGRAVKTRADYVHVKRGDPFTIKCIADSALKYCWLRSPNGTSYSITQDTEAASPFVLHYQGDGLTFGECGAEISAAVDSDGGQWSCLMGVADGGEITAVALVTVTESYLVAEQTEIAVSPQNDPVLSCHILPRMLDRTVHYCRWIRPDGYGIYNDISYRYTTNSSYSQCRLVILNYCPGKDDGNWTCVAGLMGKNGHLEEAWDHIGVHVFKNTVYDVSRLAISLSIAISVSVSVLVCGVLGGYIWGRYRLRRSLPREPPAYNSQEYYPSKSVQSEFDHK